MNFLKNNPVKITAAVIAVLFAVFGIICFCLNFYAGTAVLVLGIVIEIIYIADSKKRYDIIASFAEQLDEYIYSDSAIDLSQYCEGDVRILQCEISKLLYRLRQQSEMLKKDKLQLVDYIADISHQLRTPMTSVNLYLAALQNEEMSPEKRNEYYFEIKKQIERVDWLISSLLKLARLDADAVYMKKDSVSLSKLVETAIQPLEITMEVREQEPVTDISGNVICDLEWTAQAVGNIIKNCTEHMQEGKIYISGRENPIYSELVIRDTGKGFDADDIPHLFERFYKGKNSSDKSIGIGLALTQRIIVMQNGTVKASNSREGGAKFTLRFYKSSV